MKSKEELKKALHKLIDGIDDEQVLNTLHEDVLPYAIKKRRTKEPDDDLTEAQIEELDKAIAEADRGETISLEEFKQMTDKWRTK
jgi:hypothetical protein